MLLSLSGSVTNLRPLSTGFAATGLIELIDLAMCGRIGPMTAWKSDELDRIADAEELQVAGRRSDGTLRAPVTIWVVRQGDDLFVRSFRGKAGRWYRGTQASHEGHIRSGGVDKDVRFVAESDESINARIDAAYRTKYHDFEASIVDPILAAPARATTMRLVPR